MVCRRNSCRANPFFRDSVDELLAFLGDAPLVAHNAAFDFGFLNNELDLIGRAPVSMDRMIDTVAIARKKHPGAKLSLDALCSRYGVDRSHRVKHGALLDAELLAQVYIELTGGRQIGLELASDRVIGNHVNGQPRDHGVAIASRHAGNRAYREPRPHAPSAAEIARHQAFINDIANPLWAK